MLIEQLESLWRERGVTNVSSSFLANVGSVSPYVGLFGTVGELLIHFRVFQMPLKQP